LNELEFYLGGWTEDDFFYIPSSVIWSVNEDPGTFGDRDPVSQQEAFYPFDITEWLLPLDDNFGHVKETSNPTELKVFPIDLEIEPQFVQYGRRLWTHEEPPED